MVVDAERHSSKLAGSSNPYWKEEEDRLGKKKPFIVFQRRRKGQALIIDKGFLPKAETSFEGAGQMIRTIHVESERGPPLTTCHGPGSIAPGRVSPQDQILGRGGLVLINRSTHPPDGSFLG